jgi:ubiquinone/menaquinone biosynthesis C-methylase UbiE
MGHLKLDSKEFFNSMAEKWDTTVFHDTSKIQKILDMLFIKEGEKVLDVGTGTGVMIPFLISYTGSKGKIIAVDMAEKMIEIARHKCTCDNVEFIEGDIFNIELPDNYFDCVMCYSVFPHFQDKRAAIQKFAKKLRKKGRIIICHSQSRKEINNLHKKTSDAVSNDTLPTLGTIRNYYDLSGLKTVAEIDNDEMFVIIGCKV